MAVTTRLVGAALAAALVSAAGPAAARAAGPEPKSVALVAPDGVELAGRYWRGGSASPAVILLDDLGADANPARCDAVARALATAGCAVVGFDFRGHGRSTDVGSDFWANPTNRALVRGPTAARPADRVTFADFRPGYLPHLANDVAAARSFLERRNDQGECNVGQLIVVGFGRGATVGMLWAATEWCRYRSYGGLPERLRPSPEGKDVAGCVWVWPEPKLDRQVMPVADWLKAAEARRSVLVGWVHDGDGAAKALARRCAGELNRPGDRIFVDQVLRPSAGADQATDAVTELVASIRKLQEMPVRDDRDFADRRYVWSLPNTGRLAKPEGDDTLRPLPVEWFYRR
jgi:pimeloyl-ACP methyl ester carboxylesterase